jgi:hypothetical protein
MDDKNNIINQQIAKYGNISAYYHFWDVEDDIAQDITETIFRNSSDCRDSFINMAYPELHFELTKYNDKRGYQIAFVGYGWVSDTNLQFTRRIYEVLQKKYTISIVFLDNKRNITFEYSNKNYWKTLLKNNFILYLILPPVIILLFFLGNYLTSLLATIIKNNDVLDTILENAIYPLIGYPISVLAFKIQPMITITKIANCLVVLLTTFAFYLFTGNGLIGALILLVIFILRSIQSSIS